MGRKLGKLEVLVSAAALEEGVDVAECGFVVRDTYVATTKTHVQGSGRARRPDSVVYYFENDPYREQEREKDLKARCQERIIVHE